jgi:predicted outer membrane lipoprotein
MLGVMLLASALALLAALYLVQMDRNQRPSPD